MAAPTDIVRAWAAGALIANARRSRGASVPRRWRWRWWWQYDGSEPERERRNGNAIDAARRRCNNDNNVGAVCCCGGESIGIICVFLLRERA